MLLLPFPSSPKLHLQTIRFSHTDISIYHYDLLLVLSSYHTLQYSTPFVHTYESSSYLLALARIYDLYPQSTHFSSTSTTHKDPTTTNNQIPHEDTCKPIVNQSTPRQSTD